jgi:hypothetical protein
MKKVSVGLALCLTLLMVAAPVLAAPREPREPRTPQQKVVKILKKLVGLEEYKPTPPIPKP